MNGLLVRGLLFVLLSGAGAALLAVPYLTPV